MAAGRYDLVNNPAGQGGGRLTMVRPARDIFDRLVSEATVTLERLAARVNNGARA